MKTYFIERFSPENFTWDKVTGAEVDSWVWSRAYTPKVTAKAAIVGDELWIRLWCCEKNPKAVGTKFFDDVYKDSCMEAFFTFPGADGYINCEMNSLRASLIAYGPDRHNRTRLDELSPSLPKITASSDADTWTVGAVFTPEILRAVFGDAAELTEGKVLRGNFYKCGDETAVPHYGSWNPIGTPEPDFHRPEFFGEWQIK